jgi:hypothetical protein
LNYRFKQFESAFSVVTLVCQLAAVYCELRPAFIYPVVQFHVVSRLEAKKSSKIHCGATLAQDLKLAVANHCLLGGGLFALPIPQEFSFRFMHVQPICFSRFHQVTQHGSFGFQRRCEQEQVVCES